MVECARFDRFTPPVDQAHRDDWTVVAAQLRDRADRDWGTQAAAPEAVLDAFESLRWCRKEQLEVLTTAQRQVEGVAAEVPGQRVGNRKLSLDDLGRHVAGGEDLRQVTKQAV